MGYGIVVKIHSSQHGTWTHNLYSTKSPSNAGRDTIHYTIDGVVDTIARRFGAIEVVGSSPVRGAVYFHNNLFLLLNIAF